MALQNILPNIQADAGGAQLHLHPVPVPNGLAETGRMMTDAGQGLMKASFGLMVGLKRQNDEMVAKEDALALAEAKNGWMKSMTEDYVNWEKRTGSEAAGITNEFKASNAPRYDRFAAKLNPNNQRLFKIWVEQQSLSFWQRVQGHEDKNVNGALIAQGEQGMNDAIAMHGQMGDSRSMSNLIQSARELYATIYGGSSDEEAIGKFVQGYVDKAHGARVSQLLESGDVTGAEKYFNSIGKDGVPGASEVALAKMKSVLTDQIKDRNINMKVDRLMTKIDVAAGEGSVGGMFNTEEGELAFLNEYNDLMSGSDEDKETARRLKIQYSAKKELRGANMAAAIASLTKDKFQSTDLQIIGHDLIEFKRGIDMLPDGREDKKELMKLYNKLKADYDQDIKTAEEKNLKAAETLQAKLDKQREAIVKDPARKTAAAYVKMIAGGAHDGRIKAGQTWYNLKNKNEREAFFLKCKYGVKGGFLLEEDIEAINELIENPQRSHDRVAAADMIADVLNEGNKSKPWDFEEVNRAAPGLIDDVLRFQVNGTPKTAAEKLAVRKYIEKRLLEEREEIVDPYIIRAGSQLPYVGKVFPVVYTNLFGTRGFNGKTMTYKEFLYNGIDDNGNYTGGYGQAEFERLVQTGEQRTKLTNSMKEFYSSMDNKSANLNPVDAAFDVLDSIIKEEESNDE